MINAKRSIKEKSLYNNSITQSISSIPRVHPHPSRIWPDFYIQVRISPN